VADNGRLVRFGHRATRLRRARRLAEEAVDLARVTFGSSRGPVRIKVGPV